MLSHPPQRREWQLRDARRKEIIVFNDVATGEQVILQWIDSYPFSGEWPWLNSVVRRQKQNQNKKTGKLWRLSRRKM